MASLNGAMVHTMEDAPLLSLMLSPTTKKYLFIENFEKQDYGRYVA